MLTETNYLWWVLTVLLIFTGCDDDSRDGGSPPSSFALISPTSGAQGLTSQPILTWNDAVGETSYTIQIDDESGFSSPLTYENGNISADNTSFAVPAGVVQSNKTYYWRVLAVNGSGHTLSSNGPFEFKPYSWAFTLGGTGGDEILATQELDDGSYLLAGPIVLEPVGMMVGFSDSSRTAKSPPRPTLPI